MNTACPSETALQGRIIGERVVVVRPSPLRNNKENSVAQIKIPDLSLPKDVGYVVIDRHEGRENKKRSRGTSHASSSQEIGTPNHEVQGETTPIRILSEQKTPSSQLQWNGQIPQRNLCQYSQQPYQSVSRLDSSLTHQPAAKIHYSSTTSPYIQHYSPIVHQPEPFHYHQPQVTTYPTIPSTISHSIHQYAAKEQPLLGSISQQTFESPASKQIQLQQSSVHLDSNLPSEFNTYNSVGMKRDLSKPPQHGTSQDDMGSEGKIVIRSRSPSISQKAYSDMQYIPNAHHQQSRESTVSRVTSVQEDLNQMSRNSGTMSNTHELSTGFERSSQAPVLHSDFPHQKAQQYISHSHYNTAGSTYNHSRKFDDSKTQGLLAKIQELRDTNEMKDSQVLLLHRENSILKDNIELLKRKVQVVSSDLRDKGSMLKQRESEIQQLTHSLTHFTNKQFYVNEASTQTDQLLELPTANDDRNFYSFNNINPFPCSVSGSECKQRTQQDTKIDELDKQIKANGLVPEGFIIIKSQVVEELKDSKHVLEKQVTALTQEVEFLNNYIRTELTSYTQGIAHLKEDIKFMKSQNSKIGSTLPEAQGARTNASVQSWEDSTLPGSKQISVCTNAVLQEKTPKPAEIELEAVRISMEKMRQSFTQEKEQLLVENIKLKRKIHQIRQGPLQMRSLAGDPVQNGRQFPVVPILNAKGSHQVQPLPQESISAHQRDSLGSIDLVPNGYCSNQIGSLSQPGRREPFTKQHTHGGEMNTKPEVVDKKVCIPQLHLDLVMPKKEEMADIDSLYQSHRLSLEGDHQEDSSDAGQDSRHSSPGSHKHHNFH